MIRRMSPSLASLLTGVLAAVALPATGPVAASDDGSTTMSDDVANAPYLGWSSWSSFRCDVTDQSVRDQALALHTKLQSHGYTYVNIDSDCDNFIDEYGRKIYNPSKFPDGIRPLSDYVHGLGLKLGVYATPGIPIPAVEANTPIAGTPYHARDIVYPPAPGRPGNSLCQYGNTFQNSCRIDYGKPGAQAFIDSWAQLLANDWQVDFLKLDAVSPGSSTTDYDTRDDVGAWSEAIARLDRPIHLELSWHLDINHAEFWRDHADGWRIDDDIECYNTCPDLTTWANPFGYTRDTILSRFFDAAPWAAFAGPDGRSNLDSLPIGNGADSGLSVTERRSAMTLWAIAGSPLYSGDDLTRLDRTGLELYTNDRVLAVNQAGVAGHLVGAESPYHDWSPQQVWAARQPDGSYAVALFNLQDTPQPVTAEWQDVGFCGAADVTDIWTGDGLGRKPDRITRMLDPHASIMLRVDQTTSSDCPDRQPLPARFYEAEDASNTVTAPASVAGCGGCSGGQKVGNLFNGGAVRFNDVSVPRGGTYALTLHYTAGDERTGYVSVDDGPEQLIGFFPRTAGWDSVGTYQILIRLHSGSNTIEYATHAGPGTFPGPRTYSPDLDGISVAALGSDPR